MKRNPYAELGSAHRILKTAGATRHRDRMRNVPVWANDKEKIKQYIQARFPKMETDPDQRKSAARVVRVVYLYYIEGSTAAQVSEAIGVTVGAVNQIIFRVNRSLSGTLRPSHRLKKPVHIDSNSEGAVDLTL